MVNVGKDRSPAGLRLRRSLPQAPAEPPITPEHFSKFQALIYQEAGIWLGDHKTALLTGRLARRLRLLGLTSMWEYYKLVTHPDQQHERAVMLDYITTNETHFFRQPQHFDFLTQHLFPQWKHQAAAGNGSKRIRVWSAGCSTGEEPYTLAMILFRHFPPETGWDLEVLATDISMRTLENARTAIFSADAVHEIPKDYLHAYMLKGTEDQKGFIKVSPEVQRLVRFSRVNLHADTYPVNGSFDLIFCRNVLIYFDQDSKKKAISGLMRHLSPGGLLFVGHSENLNGVTRAFRSVASTIYRVSDPDGRGAMPMENAVVSRSKS